MIKLMFEILFSITEFVFRLALLPFIILLGSPKPKKKSKKNKDLNPTEAMILGITLFDDYDD